jgi:hypothetical protein
VNRGVPVEVIELLSLKEEVPIVFDHAKLGRREPPRKILKVELVSSEFDLPPRHEANGTSG